MKNDQASVTRLLQTWDRGSKSTRVKMLQDFVCENTYKTGPELELEFAHAASLFLTRLTAWLRLTYMMGTHVKIQLQAIGIFVGASSGHKFLAEFLEVGGVLTVLEILGLNQAKEEDKAEALKILMHVVNAGRRYKELVCESFGIRAVAECLAKSNSEETQDLARNLLHQLSNGNPKYENQVYKALIALLKSSSPKAQQMAAQTLRIIQPVIGTASPTIVDPVLMLLRSLHLEVQYEACELIKDLMQYNIRNAILKGLVSLLKPTKDDVQESAESVIADPDSPQLQPPLPIYVQQAAAAKMICILAKESPEIAESLVQLRAVHGILLAMGNTLYAESQRQAGIALEFFVRSFPLVNDRVKEALGDKSYEEFMTQPDNMFVNMTAIQADVLVSNKVNIPGDSPYGLLECRWRSLVKVGILAHCSSNGPRQRDLSNNTVQERTSTSYGDTRLEKQCRNLSRDYNKEQLSLQHRLHGALQRVTYSAIGNNAAKQVAEMVAKSIIPFYFW